MRAGARAWPGTPSESLLRALRAARPSTDSRLSPVLQPRPRAPPCRRRCDPWRGAARARARRAHSGRGRAVLAASRARAGARARSAAVRQRRAVHAGQRREQRGAARRCSAHNPAPGPGRPGARADGPSLRGWQAVRQAPGSGPARRAPAALAAPREGAASRSRRSPRASRRAANDYAVCREHGARGDEHIGMERDGAHPQGAPSSLAASRRLGTSAVGLRWEESSVSLVRLTQITGTRCLTHGTTSW